MKQPDSSSVFFPSEPILDSTDMKQMKWLLYGPPGVGKSTFFSGADDILFLTTDGGHKFIRSMNRPIENWFMFKKYVKAITTDRPKQYRAIGFDVVDGLFQMCNKYVCEKRGIEHISDEQWGKGYDLLTQEFISPFLSIIGLQQYGLFFLSHSIEIEKKTRLSTVTKTIPTMKRKAFELLQPIMDIISYYGFDGTMSEDGEPVRRMYFQPTESMEAKDRTKRLPESMMIPDPERANGFEMVQRYLSEGPKKKIAHPQQKKKLTLKRK